MIVGEIKVRDTSAYISMLLSAGIGDVVFPGFLIFLPLLAFQLGADALEIGVVGGAANAMYGFMPYIMGRFSDKMHSRYSFIIVSFAILTLVALLDSLYPSPLNLIFFRLAEGVAWALLYPALQAGLSELGTRNAQRSLAAYNMVWSGSFAIGPLVVGTIVFLTSIRFTFLVISGLLFLTMLVNIATLGRKKRGQSDLLLEKRRNRNKSAEQRDIDRRLLHHQSTKYSPERTWCRKQRRAILLHNDSGNRCSSKYLLLVLPAACLFHRIQLLPDRSRVVRLRCLAFSYIPAAQFETKHREESAKHQRQKKESIFVRLRDLRRLPPLLCPRSGRPYLCLR